MSLSCKHVVFPLSHSINIIIEHSILFYSNLCLYLCVMSGRYIMLKHEGSSKAGRENFLTVGATIGSTVKRSESGSTPVPALEYFSRTNTSTLIPVGPIKYLVFGE